MKLTKSLLQPIHKHGKSFARAIARKKRSAIENNAKIEADGVYPDVKKGHKNYEAKQQFIQNRIVAASQPREREIQKARKALNERLAVSAERGRAR